MPAIESVALVAASAIKLAIKLCMPEGKTTDAVADTASKLLEGRIKEYLPQRKATRLFGELEDEISGRLVRLISTEFAGIADSDILAVSSQLSDFIQAQDITALSVVANLNGVILFSQLEASAAELFKSLGGDTSTFARRYLREVCEYVVVIVDRLPDFRRTVSRELLNRTDEIIRDVSQLLQRVDDMRKHEDQAQSDQILAFETDYRRLLVQHLDRIVMFGLRKLNVAAREYPLSVSYISLSSSDRSGQARSVEDAIAAKQRVVVRGEAGSGKSTLLQWLAVRAASRDLGSSLAGLADRMPIYLRLRDYASAARLPAPESFLELSWAAHLSAAQPQLWTHSWLRKGALVLIDGFDELPIQMRRQFRDWIRSLIDSFPASTFVVSSRPAALDADPDSDAATDFMERFGFESVSIEQLSLVDIESLVERWHLALQKDSGSDEMRDKLLRSSIQLKRVLRERRSLRALATTPLLCAMMCALNWHLNQRLPASRMDLYQLALEMLLEQRDSDRDIWSGRNSNLSLQAKQSVLDRIAYWMLKNGQSEMSTEEAVNPVRSALDRLPQITVDAEEILQELLERSGVLRQPGHGRVDFIHRTFLEYMGARAAINDHDLGLLASRAKDDNWRETIVFAAGHAKGASRDKFISMLLPKALSMDRSIDRRVAAACCLETAVEGLDSKVFRALTEVARGLFPPKNIEQARALAPAAELEPKLLVQGAGKQSPTVVAACIRCASLVGGVEMLSVIAELAAGLTGEIPDEVRGELIRAWSAFDAEEYSARVVQGSPWLSSLLSAYENISKEQREDSMRCLQLFGSRDQFRSGFSSVISLVDAFHKYGEIRLETGRRDEMPWDPTPMTRNGPLHQRGGQQQSSPTTVSLEDAQNLAAFTTLRTLSATGTRVGGVLTKLASLGKLEGLCLSVSQEDDYAVLEGMKNLRHLSLVDDNELRSRRRPKANWLSFLRGLDRLETVWLTGLSPDCDLTSIEDLSVSRLDLMNCTSAMVDVAGRAPKVRVLRIVVRDRSAKDLRIDLSKCGSLDSLYLEAPRTQSIHLVVPRSIRRIDLASAKVRLTNAQELLRLEDLRLFQLDELQNSEGLLEVPSLKSLVQEMCNPVNGPVFVKLNQRGVRCS